MTEAARSDLDMRRAQLRDEAERTKRSLDILDDGLAATANVTMHERWLAPSSRFGELTGAQLTQIVNQLDRGYLEDWIDLVQFFLTTDTDFAHLHAQRIERLVQQDWRIVPASDGDARLASLAAEFCDEHVRRIQDLHRAFKFIAHAITPGFSANEMIWKIDSRANCYVVDRIEHRHGHRFRYSPTWTLRLYDRGQRQGPDGYGEVLDPRKWIVHTHADQAGYPSVYGLARSVAWDLLFLRYGRRFRITGVEKFGNPYVWLTIVSQAKPEVRQKALRALEKLSATQVGVFEDGNTLNMEMPASSQGAGTPQKMLIDDLVGALTRRYLGTSDATTPGEHGSNAAVETRTEAQTDPLTNGDIKAFCYTISETLLKQMCRINWHKFGVQSPDDIPTPKLERAEPPKPVMPQPPEITSGDEEDDEGDEGGEGEDNKPPPPTPPQAPPPPGDSTRMERDPKASASGEPRRSRTTSISHAIRSAGLPLER